MESKKMFVRPLAWLLAYLLVFLSVPVFAEVSNVPGENLSIRITGVSGVGDVTGDVELEEGETYTVDYEIEAKGPGYYDLVLKYGDTEEDLDRLNAPLPFNTYTREGSVTFTADSTGEFQLRLVGKRVVLGIFTGEDITNAFLKYSPKQVAPQPQADSYNPAGDTLTIRQGADVPQPSNFVSSQEDGFTGAAQSFEFVGTAPSSAAVGTFEVKIKVTYKDGSTDTVEAGLIVEAPPQYSFKVAYYFAIESNAGSVDYNTNPTSYWPNSQSNNPSERVYGKIYSASVNIANAGSHTVIADGSDYEFEVTGHDGKFGKDNATEPLLAALKAAGETTIKLDNIDIDLENDNVSFVPFRYSMQKDHVNNEKIIHVDVKVIREKVKAKVNYYYDGVLAEEQTVEREGYVGDIVKVEANAPEGYKLDGVKLGNEALTANADGTYSVTLTKNPQPINVHYVKKEYTVTFKPENEGENTEKLVKHGDKVEAISDPVRDGFVFKGWFEDGATESFDFANTVITKDVTLIAKWEAASTGGGGSTGGGNEGGGNEGGGNEGGGSTGGGSTGGITIETEETPLGGVEETTTAANTDAASENTSGNTIEITDEETPLGGVTGEESTDSTEEFVVGLEEEVPLGTTLPYTAQHTDTFYYSIGALFIAIGLMIRKLAK